MTKKRTAKPHYGKLQQRMEATAKRWFEQGDLENGIVMSNIVADYLRAMREAGSAIRKPAPFLPNIKGKRYDAGAIVDR